MKRLLTALTVLTIQTPLMLCAMEDPLPPTSHPQHFPNYHEEFTEVREKAIQTAKITGREEGIKEGVKEGMKEGELKKAIEVARNMIVFKVPFTDDRIAEITKLPLERVLALRLELAAEEKK